MYPEKFAPSSIERAKTDPFKFPLWATKTARSNLDSTAKTLS